jgi:hypothetical protein
VSRRVAGANVVPWRLSVVAPVALAVVDTLRPVGNGAWWAWFLATVVTTLVLCWRATVDVEDKDARAIVVITQLPLLAATFAATWWITRWWIVATFW